MHDDRLAALRESGSLRPAQVDFARLARPHFQAHAAGLLKQAPGAGKTGCITMASLGVLGPPGEGRQARTLVLNPSTKAAKHMPKEFVRFLTQNLQLPRTDVEQFACKVQVCVGGSYNKLDRALRTAWVIVTTPQTFVRWLKARPDRTVDVSEVIEDEADLGIPSVKSTGPLAWRLIRSHFDNQPSVKQLFLSATNERSDGAPMPAPFCEYSYRDALHDGVVKDIRLKYFTPERAFLDGRALDSLADAAPAERSAFAASEQCLRKVIPRALESFLKHRKRCRAPWYRLHVVVQRAGKLRPEDDEDHIRFVTRLIGEYAAPKGLSVRCAYAKGKDCDEVLEAFERGQVDVLVTCKLLQRAVSFSEIGATLVLRSFGSYSDYVQCVIGRGARLTERGRHPAPRRDEHLILELGTNGNQRHLARFFADEHVTPSDDDQGDDEEEEENEEKFKSRGEMRPRPPVSERWAETAGEMMELDAAYVPLPPRLQIFPEQYAAPMEGIVAETRQALEQPGPSVEALPIYAPSERHEGDERAIRFLLGLADQLPTLLPHQRSVPFDLPTQRMHPERAAQILARFFVTLKDRSGRWHPLQRYADWCALRDFDDNPGLDQLESQPAVPKRFYLAQQDLGREGVERYAVECTGGYIRLVMG